MVGVEGRRNGKEDEMEDEGAYVTIFSKADPTDMKTLISSLIILAAIYWLPIICQTLY